MNNNVLSKYSVEKIASSISREGIETAIDAMEYLNTSYAGANRKSDKGEKKYTKNNKKEIIEEQKEQESDNLSDEEIDALLDYFKGE